MGSLLFCPNASRALLRSGLAPRGLPAPSLLSTAPSRWLSTARACQARTPHALRRGRWHASKVPTHAPASHRLGPHRTIFSSAKITKEIFGPGLSAQEANELLRILHGRRVAGTLEDPAFAIHTAQFTPEQVAAGLAYLRKTVPVDEVVNAGLRAEDELEQLEREQQLEQEIQKNKKRVGEAKDIGEASATAYKPDPVYGRSMLDEIRARNIAKRKAKEKALGEERQRAEEEEEVAGPLAEAQEQTRLPTNPMIAEYHKEAQSDLEAPPEMKAWERILPSATAVVLVLGFLAAVCTVYEEPMPRFRLLRDIPASQATVGALIAVNALIWLGWRVPPLWSLFNRYMIFVVATVKPATLFTAPFSHKSLRHMLINMVPLWLVGTRLHEEMGRAEFLTLYVGCGAVGFLGSLATYTLRGWLTVTSLGASGATLGLCSAYFWEHRNDGFRMFGLPRDGVHGIVFLALLVAMQLASLGTTARLQVDLASHLAGMATGVLGMELISRNGSDRGKGGDGAGGTELLSVTTEAKADRARQKM
ncbi:rhomboid family protein [Hirsutella rhossiliensis]|uniref:Rhomboid family domain-containing protein n=1 Tax=Hirsutella rhossiliensis TaxID=111463 RepID=A0A9P8MZY2_9HYPO|nr:rhomboid family domain-containing protein [Hirsutella rhossiliensis]KAH0963404.1 rhomboid family domain-containing protein [Hirsutella rhossiliensis]